MFGRELLWLEILIGGTLVVIYGIATLITIRKRIESRKNKKIATYLSPK